MLVLTRRSGESIILRDDIVVQVVEVRGDKVRIGITAPKEVTVHRQEVYDLIKEDASWRNFSATLAPEQTTTPEPVCDPTNSQVKEADHG